MESGIRLELGEWVHVPDTEVDGLTPCVRCTLADARAGERFVVTSVDDEHARVTAQRFGMAEGACVACITRIPAGPIVLRAGRQEIAVGRDLAGRIGVRADTSPE